MGKLAYFALAMSALALLVGIAGSGVAGAATDSEWSVPIVADAGVEGSNADLEFGIDPDGSDGYDSGIDSLSPPPGPGALFEAHFSIVHTLFPRLIRDFRGQIPNEWTLKVRSTDEDIELSWNTADVPQGMGLTLISTETDIDMKAVNRMTLPAGAHTIKVVAEQIEIGKHYLTISSTVGGSVTTPGEGTFAYDETTVVGLVAQAEEDYQFVKWTGDVATIANINAASTTIAVQGNYTIRANFAAPTVRCNLTVSSTTGGAVTAPGEGTFAYDAGTVVNLVARAQESYRFVNWTGDVDTVANVNAASTTISMQGDCIVMASFGTRTVQYNLTISSTSGGSVTAPGEGSFAYDEGTVVSLVAEAEEGHQFVSWTGDVETIADIDAASTTITVQGNHTIMARFDRIPPPINWALICGIVAAVAAAGLGVFFFLRRRVA